MSQKTVERLERLRQLNSNRDWINHDLYRLMYSEDLYIIAYERIKSKPGNMTPGTGTQTLDGFSLEAIGGIIGEMRTEQFRFRPVRQQFIPKPNGKMRKLGIPCVRDKVVQEVMRMILEAIYDSPQGPYFQEASHGFRPQRSCHTALREIRTHWTAGNWYIEGDIRACFDELDHQVLVRLLRKKIQDERFLNLIWKLLKAGYLDLHGTKKESLIGSPQGGLISPVLANVYLHELDEFVEELRRTHEKGTKKRDNPDWVRLIHQKNRLVARGEAKTQAVRAIMKQIRATPSKRVNDPEYVRIKYLRYADDWLVGLCGSRALAEEIKEQVKTFLKDHLKLTLSAEKTRITHARTEEAFFLGTILTIGKGGETKIASQKTSKGKTIKRRSTGWETIMKAPIDKLVKRLGDRGFCTPTGEPTAKSGWTPLDADQIIQLYSGVNRGLQNYYRFVDNWKHLSRIQYILQFSLAKTLAQKYKLSVARVFQRFGKELSLTLKGTGGKADRTVCFYLNHDWGKSKLAFQSGKQIDIDVVRTLVRMRTRSKLGKPCCICGQTARQIEMHHVRHIRKLSNKRGAIGFNRILRAMNRKQIPVCSACHRKIHRGEYDGLRLSDLAYLPRYTMTVAALGEQGARKCASPVRRGGVGALRQLRPGSLPYSFRQDRTDRPFAPLSGNSTKGLARWRRDASPSLPHRCAQGFGSRADPSLRSG
jgi:group II intron reverse transcriptase/maturase